MNEAESSKTLKEISEQIKICKKCILSNSRKRSVPGEGPANTEIMLIGEGPGFYENEQGRPFVGTSGQFLSELLLKSGINRENTFITNVVKCRPPGNRDPLPEELVACTEYLDNQIDVINPLIIITLGRFSMAKYIPNVKISNVHGKAMWVKGRLIVPMYHPAAALHQPTLKSIIEKDFSCLQQYIRQARQTQTKPSSIPIVERNQVESPPTNKTDPTQLSLF